MQGRFFFAELRLGIFDGDGEQRILVAEVVVKHALVGFRPCGDAVHPCSTQAEFGKFLCCRRQNAQFRGVGITHLGFRLFCQSHLPLNNYLVIYSAALYCLQDVWILEWLVMIILL
jgi:hypothetical protein